MEQTEKYPKANPEKDSTTLCSNYNWQVWLNQLFFIIGIRQTTSNSKNNPSPRTPDSFIFHTVRVNWLLQTPGTPLRPTIPHLDNRVLRTLQRSRFHREIWKYTETWCFLWIAKISVISRLNEFELNKICTGCAMFLKSTPPRLLQYFETRTFQKNQRNLVWSEICHYRKNLRDVTDCKLVSYHPFNNFLQHFRKTENISLLQFLISFILSLFYHQNHRKTKDLLLSFKRLLQLVHLPRPTKRRPDFNQIHRVRNIRRVRVFFHNGRRFLLDDFHVNPVFDNPGVFKMVQLLGEVLRQSTRFRIDPALFTDISDSNPKTNFIRRRFSDYVQSEVRF